MNAELIRILNHYGQTTVKEIRNNLSSTGTNASGSTSKSLAFEVKDSGTKAVLRITGKPFIAVVETGRKPTPDYKPSRAFVASIREWLRAKGKPESPAYAIALSIHRKGTKLWQEGGRRDIISNVINESLIDKIGADLLEKFAEEFLNNIVVKTFRDGTNNNTTTTRS